MSKDIHSGQMTYDDTFSSDSSVVLLSESDRTRIAAMAAAAMTATRMIRRTLVLPPMVMKRNDGLIKIIANRSEDVRILLSQSRLKEE